MRPGGETLHPLAKVVGADLRVEARFEPALLGGLGLAEAQEGFVIGRRGGEQRQKEKARDAVEEVHRFLGFRVLDSGFFPYGKTPYSALLMTSFLPSAARISSFSFSSTTSPGGCDGTTVGRAWRCSS